MSRNSTFFEGTEMRGFLFLILAIAITQLPVSLVFAKGGKGSSSGSHRSSSSGSSHRSSSGSHKSSSSSHLSGTGSKSSSSSVKGYTKKNGTHVNAYKKTTPDKTGQNNYSTKGNYNPRTGKTGSTYVKK